MIPEKVDILRFMEGFEKECNNFDVLNHAFYKSKRHGAASADQNRTARNLSELTTDGYVRCPSGSYNKGTNTWMSVTAAGREAVYQYDLLQLSEERARSAELRGYIAIVISALALACSLLSIFWEPIIERGETPVSNVDVKTEVLFESPRTLPVSDLNTDQDNTQTAE